MRLLILLLLLAIWWLPAFLPRGAAAQDAVPRSNEAEGNDALAVMAEGYLANRRAFTSFLCRFRLTKGTAASVEAAMAGDIKPKLTYQGTWRVESARVYFRLDCDPRILEQFAKLPEEKKNIQKGSQGSIMSLPCSNTECVFDGERLLRYASEIACANLSPAGVVKVWPRETPFGMNVMGENEKNNPGSMLLACLAGMYSARFEGSQVINGADAMVATSGKNGEVHKKRYCLDPDRGFLPVEITSRGLPNNRLTYRAMVTQARQCTNGAWFPIRSVVVWQPEGAVPFAVDEFTVLELETENPPDMNRYAITLPAGTDVSVPTLPYHRGLNESKDVRADDLEALLAWVQTPGHLQMTPDYDASLNWVRWWIAGLTAVAIAAIVFAWRRRTRMRFR